MRPRHLPRAIDRLPRRYDPRMSSLYVGVDGGGTRTRAVATAIDRLFQSELATNPAFAEWVADAPTPADADAGEGG